MRIQIKAATEGGEHSGIYDGAGNEVPVGTEYDVDDEPTAWAGRYIVISGGDRGQKTAVTNPADVTPNGPFTTKDLGTGWHGIFDADGERLKSVRKDDAEAFDALSDEDKLAFLTEG